MSQYHPSIDEPEALLAEWREADSPPIAYKQGHTITDLDKWARNVPNADDIPAVVEAVHRLAAYAEVEEVSAEEALVGLVDDIESQVLLYRHSNEARIAAALKAGRLFNEARPLVRHGLWAQFVEERGISRMAANRWMRLAEAGLNVTAVTNAGGIHAALESLRQEEAGEDHSTMGLTEPELVEELDRVEGENAELRQELREGRGEPESGAPPRKPTGMEQLRMRLDAALMENQDLRQQRDELAQWKRAAEAEGSPFAHEREREFNSLQARVRTLEGSVAEWMTKYREAQGTIRSQARRLKQYEEGL